MNFDTPSHWEYAFKSVHLLKQIILNLIVRQQRFGRLYMLLIYLFVFFQYTSLRFPQNKVVIVAYGCLQHTEVLQKVYIKTIGE